jgi:hypothetical protein
MNNVCFISNKPLFGTHNDFSLFDGDIRYQLYIINIFPIIDDTIC